MEPINTTDEMATKSVDDLLHEIESLISECNEILASVFQRQKNGDKDELTNTEKHV